MPDNIKKMFSFFYPVLIKKYHSKISGDIELSMQDGKLVLDSSTANYSYGSLHKLFQKVIKKFDFNNKEYKTALILGFGGGSIAEILNCENQLNLEITALEKDRVVVNVYHEYFKKEAHNTKLIEGDAIMFLKNNTQKFDYIFVDVFKNLDVPEEFKTSSFLKLLSQASAPHTQIAMNVIVQAGDEFVSLWEDHFTKNSLVKQMTSINSVLFSLPEK